MPKKWFGTDGVRGVANDTLIPERAFQIGRAFGALLRERYLNPSTGMGKDTRISSDMLEAALSAGLCSSGVQVKHYGIVPTPAVPVLDKIYGTDGGVMITASHCPVEDNGIKIFSKEGFKLFDEEEALIESWAKEKTDFLPRPTGLDIGTITSIPDAGTQYLEWLQSKANFSLQGFTLILDCAYGAAYWAAPELFRHLGAKVIALHNQPEGAKVNVNCGATDLDTLSQRLKPLILKHKADAALTFDGDADRCIALDDKGEVVNGDDMLFIFARSLDARRPKIVVATLMSNMGLDPALSGMGITLLRAPVGDRYVLEEMQKHHAVLGGEQSGHIIFLDDNTTGDGLLTALNLMQAVKNSGTSLSQLRQGWYKFPQLLDFVLTSRKDEALRNDAVNHEIALVKQRLEGKGRLSVRPSGTEPKVRILLEGPDRDELAELNQRLKDIITTQLTV